MEWINLHQSTLSSAEFLRSVPSERGTWLSLLGYCCQQENGGFIAECAEWKDRTWQQIAGVTLREVRAKCRLWTWENGGVRVFAYPVEKERELKVERAAGRLGGLTKQKNKLLAALPAEELPTLLPTLEGMPLPTQVETLQASLLRKGRERKGKEGNGIQLPPPTPARGLQIPTLDDARAYAVSFSKGNTEMLDITMPIVTQWFDDRESIGWETVKGGTPVPITDWQADLRKYARSYTKNERNLPVNGSPRRPHGERVVLTTSLGWGGKPQTAVSASA
jgi:hypothetical protein